MEFAAKNFLQANTINREVAGYVSYYDYCPVYSRYLEISK